nr:hypothetical protein [Tanacetum cinerariifolium]
MDLSDIEVPRVFVTCRNMDDWTENCILLHYTLGQQLELTGILQLVLLGIEDRRPVPNWILRLANDIVSWDNYPWGSYVWPTLYKHLRDANVKRWQPLYASELANETDTKSYSIEGQLPVERLVSDETEARSLWWVSSRAYFGGCSFEEEQIPHQLNRNNYFEVPSKMYRDFDEQRRGYQQMKEKNVDMYEKLTRFMEDIRRVPEAHTTPIIADQHFGVSDMSGFQSYRGTPSAFNTLANNNSFFNMPTPSNSQTPNQSNWPGTSNWQNPMPSRRQDAGILDPYTGDAWLLSCNWTTAP